MSAQGATATNPQPSFERGLFRALARNPGGLAGLIVLAVMVIACVGTLPWTLARVAAPGGSSVARFNAGTTDKGRLPPAWASRDDQTIRRLNALVPPKILENTARDHSVTTDQLVDTTSGPTAAALRPHWPRPPLGTDVLGRSLFIRVLTGGGISLCVGIAAATLSVCIGTLYGALAGYAGGRVDGLMMRVVDILYGLPYLLLVVLLAVASGALVDEYVSRQKERSAWVRSVAREHIHAVGAKLTPSAIRDYLDANPELKTQWERQALEKVPPRELSERTRTTLDLLTLLVAIGGVSWLTMARVIRGQVLSLKNQPFIEAARALGLPPSRILFRHLLPNLVGPIIVYATLTIPQAILQESFLSFLGIGVRPPLPSWGNLAAEGLVELNPYRSYWWLLVFPCLLLGLTLLALNFVGEALREAWDPKRIER